MRNCVLCGCELKSTKRSAYHIDCLKGYRNLVKRQRHRHLKPEESEVEYVMEEVERQVEWLIEQPAKKLNVLGPDAGRTLLDIKARVRHLSRSRG